MAEIFFQGGAGRLEAQYHQSEQKDAPIALILHPNPQLGGTMNNKVVYTLFQAFVRLGFSVLRFNFRGVGKSQGIFDGEPESELTDALAAWDFLKNLNPNSNKCWIAGYSFGAMVGFSVLMRRPDINGFVAVSPPADICDFSFLNPCPSNGVIIQGGMDTVVSEPSVAALAERLDNTVRSVKVDYVLLPEANHLYENQLRPVFDAVLEHVPPLMVKRKKKKGERT